MQHFLNLENSKCSEITKNHKHFEFLMQKYQKSRKYFKIIQTA